MDSADIAAVHDFTEEMLNKHQNRGPETKVARGRCLYCDTKLLADRIYCDTDCREAHEREQRIKGNK